MIRKPIPWVYTDGEIAKFWIWKTPEFEVRIFAEGRIGARTSFGWKITDLSRGREIPFDSSVATTFQEAVDTILEIIGKSYPRKLGYLTYAGDLATTFQIGTGQKLDFASFSGESVIVKIVADDGAETVLVGVLQVENYLIKVRSEDNIVTSFPPARIKDVQKQFGGISLSNREPSKAVGTKLKRVFHTEYTRGCTGRPGFLPHTVMHGPADEYCSIHKV